MIESLFTGDWMASESLLNGDLHLITSIGSMVIESMVKSLALLVRMVMLEARNMHEIIHALVLEIRFVNPPNSIPSSHYTIIMAPSSSYK